MNSLKTELKNKGKAKKLFRQRQFIASIHSLSSLSLTREEKYE